MVLAQLLVLAVVFNKGRPHRSPLWTNAYLTAALLLQVGGVGWGLLPPADDVCTEVCMHAQASTCLGSCVVHA